MNAGARERGFKKILLIVPPFYRLMGGRNNWMNLGLSYVAATLNTHGHAVKIYNADHGAQAKDIDLREIFETHERYKEIINNLDHPIWKEIADRIIQYSPDLVGITIVFSATLKSVQNIAQKVKQYNKNIKVVVGGPHATLASETTLSNPYIDYLVRGEGEHTLRELVEGKELASIDGLCYKDNNGKIIYNSERKFIENLDELPFPDPNLQLIPFGDFNENFGVITTSRGCPRRCVFCSSPALWGRRVRVRSIDNIIAELNMRYHEYGVKQYYFSDDNFNLSKKYAKDLCRAIIANNLKIRFFCEVNLIQFDKELMELMKEAGCVRLKLGMESGNDRILKLMKKGTTVERIRKTCALAKDAGIPYTLYTMIGMPSETLEEMRDTLELARELDADYVSLSVATPQVGSELYHMAAREGKELPPDNPDVIYFQRKGSFLNENITPDIIEEFLSLNDREGKGLPYKLALED